MGLQLSYAKALEVVSQQKPWSYSKAQIRAKSQSRMYKKRASMESRRSKIHPDTVQRALRDGPAAISSQSSRSCDPAEAQELLEGPNQRKISVLDGQEKGQYEEQEVKNPL